LLPEKFGDCPKNGFTRLMGLRGCSPCLVRLWTSIGQGPVVRTTWCYTGWAKKVSQMIFAITLPTASQFPQFLAHIHYRKFAIRRCIVSPPNTVCVTALPCKILITTLPICLYMFTTINNNKYKHICTLDIVYVKKRHNADYGTLLKCYPWP